MHDQSWEHEIEEERRINIHQNLFLSFLAFLQLYISTDKGNLRTLGTMDSPEKELTSLVPSSVFARNRKTSRHGYTEEPVVPGRIDLVDLSTSPIQSRKGLLFDDITTQRETSPTEEELEALRRKGLAAAREKRVHGHGTHANGKGKQPVYEAEVEYVGQLIGGEVTSEKVLQKRRESVIVAVTQGEESDDEGQDLCVICLQAVRDATIVGECGHKIFCVSCVFSTVAYESRH